MVAMADRSHPTQSPAHVAYHQRTMTQTMSQVTKFQRWGSPLALRPRVGYSFSSSLTGIGDQQFKAPTSTQPFLASRVLPTSKVMSSQIIQSFWNHLLFFARPPFGEFTQHKATIPLETKWIPCKVNMLIFPEGNQSNESISLQTSRNDHTTEQPHQRETNTVCDSKECESTRVVNLITTDDITHCENQEMGPVATESTAELCAKEESDLSDYEPSHSEYESDDDDCVKFSDESFPLPESQVLAPPNSTKYVTLVSSESGYFECAPGCEQLDERENLEDDWSDSDSDGEIEFCSEVWDSFEIQALSPMVKCTRAQTKTNCSKTEEESWSATGKVDTSTCQTHISEALELPNKEEIEADYVTVHNPKKRVSFKPDNELVEVHTIVAWEYAYRAARRGPWEQFARDRCHFRRRIDSVSAVLEPCLSAKLTRISSVRKS